MPGAPTTLAPPGPESPSSPPKCCLLQSSPSSHLQGGGRWEQRALPRAQLTSSGASSDLVLCTRRRSLLLEPQGWGFKAVFLPVSVFPSVSEHLPPHPPPHCAYAPSADWPIRCLLGRDACLFIVALGFLCFCCPAAFPVTSPSRRGAHWTQLSAGRRLSHPRLHVLSLCPGTGRGCTSRRTQSEGQLVRCKAILSVFTSVELG